MGFVQVMNETLNVSVTSQMLIKWHNGEAEGDGCRMLSLFQADCSQRMGEEDGWEYLLQNDAKHLTTDRKLSCLMWELPG